MKKQLLILLLTVFHISFSKTSVWEISHNGNHLYLGGSFYLRPNDYPLPIEFDSAFEKSDKIVFVADSEKIKSQEGINHMAKIGLLEGNKTLKEVLSKRTYHLLESEALKIPSFDISTIMRLHHNLGGIVLYVKKLEQFGVLEELEVGKYYHSKSAEKQIDFLETTQGAIDMSVDFAQGSRENCTKFLINQVIRKVKKEYPKIVSDWKNGTASRALNKSIRHEKRFKNICDYYTPIVAVNNRWVAKIEDYLTDTTVEFILVHVVRLHGSDGLLNKLKEKGYQVRYYELD